MTAEFDRLRDEMVATDRRLSAALAMHETWIKVHDVDCGRRYDSLKTTVAGNHKVTMIAMCLLAAVAIGLRSKFGSEILGLLGLL